MLQNLYAKRVVKLGYTPEICKRRMEVTYEQIVEFCESAEVYGVNSSVWLVDGDKLLATHCSDVTFNRADWGAVYEPTYEKFLEFLKDENWKKVAEKYPQFQE